jgi:hypothetical protein
MSKSPVVPQSELQRVIVELALVYAQQLEQVAQAAPAGQLLDHCENAALDHGRQFLRDSLTAALQQQIQEAEKKGAQLAPVLTDTHAATKGPTRAGS